MRQNLKSEVAGLDADVVIESNFVHRLFFFVIADIFKLQVT